MGKPVQPTTLSLTTITSIPEPPVQSTSLNTPSNQEASNVQIEDVLSLKSHEIIDSVEEDGEIIEDFEFDNIFDMQFHSRYQLNFEADHLLLEWTNEQWDIPKPEQENASQKRKG